MFTYYCSARATYFPKQLFKTTKLELGLEQILSLAFEPLA